MNTIPLTFNEHQIPCTVLGGRESPKADHLNVSVIVLNSIGSHFKLPLFEELLKCNFETIVSVEPDRENYNLEEISHRYPSAKFIIPLEDASEGEMINIAMSEIKSEYVLVLKDTLYIPSGVLLPNLAENLTEKKPFCVVPRLVDSNRNALPILKYPSAAKSRFQTESLTQVSDGINTLYPFDFIAIYNREQFIEIGGFDYTIKSPYWQLLDFGLRSYLWGKKISITTKLQLSYAENAPVEDKTPVIESLRVYLKNQLPKFKTDHAFISAQSFWRFFFHSKCGILEARRQFLDAKSWVKINQYRFQTDLPNLIEFWKI